MKGYALLFDLAPQKPTTRDIANRVKEVGAREAQRLEYRLAVKGQEPSYLVVIWLDLKTGLPLKRTVFPWEAKEKMVLVETYTKLTLDQKVDTKNFDFPK